MKPSTIMNESEAGLEISYRFETSKPDFDAQYQPFVVLLDIFHSIKNSGRSGGA